MWQFNDRLIGGIYQLEARNGDKYLTIKVRYFEGCEIECKNAIMKKISTYGM